VDGTLDCIATDHAPHHQDEKKVEFHIAASGISGFETAFCVSYTELVRAGHMTLPQLIEKMSTKPAQLLGVPGGELTVGAAADIVILDPEKEITVDAEKFVSRGHNTPFHGRTYYGAVLATIVGGRVIDQQY
ncbi:MAG: amidohydrolase family protein, partial [Clostridia bacterium]|nr:amidohydrolase family protein [Clostridia bacterium]